jgi:hypothetical protein
LSNVSCTVWGRRERVEGTYAVLVIAVKRFVGADQGLLGDVLGVGGTDERSDSGVEAVLIADHQLGKSSIDISGQSAGQPCCLSH